MANSSGPATDPAPRAGRRDDLRRPRLTDRVTLFGETHVVATHKRVTFGVDPMTGNIRWQYEGYRRGTIEAEVAISPDGRLFYQWPQRRECARANGTKRGRFQFIDVYNDGPDKRSSTRACSEWRRGHWYDSHLYHVSNHFASHGLLCMDVGGTVRWNTKTKDRAQRGPSSAITTRPSSTASVWRWITAISRKIRLNADRYEELGSIAVFTQKDLRFDGFPVPEHPSGMNARSGASKPTGQQYLGEARLRRWTLPDPESAAPRLRPRGPDCRRVGGRTIQRQTRAAT